jgi:hypothetical protein
MDIVKLEVWIRPVLFYIVDFEMDIYRNTRKVSVDEVRRDIVV